MREYHKIQTVYHRDPATKHKTLLEGEYALPEFAYLAGVPWDFTEKVDGTNIRVLYLNPDAEQPERARVSFGGKTDNAQIPTKLLDHLAATFTVDKMRDAFPNAGGVCLYGEGYGAGIQKGGIYRPDQSFVLFDVWAGGWDAGVWLRRGDVQDVGEKLGIDTVPIIGTGTLPEMVERVREGFTSIFSFNGRPALAEGIVARPAVDLFDRMGRRIITKLKYTDFVR